MHLSLPGRDYRTTMTDSETWGRIADDGTVFVRTADGERAIGSWQAGSVEGGLAFSSPPLRRPSRRGRRARGAGRGADRGPPDGGGGRAQAARDAADRLG